MTLLSLTLRRLLAGLPLLLVLPLLTFLMMHFVPGNYFDSLRLNPQISKETIEQYERMYHLDQPFWAQYLHWLKNLFHFDLGYSFAFKQPVAALLLSRLGNTLLLTTASFLIAWVLAVLLGLAAGMNPKGWMNRCLSAAAYLGLSVPGFFLALLLLYLSSKTGWLPLGGMRSPDYDSLTGPQKIADIARHMVLPVTVLALNSFSYLFRLMRAETGKASGMDFVLFLRACRVPERMIVYKHVARNAVNPLITLFGLELPALFSGAALVEIFTGWPGLGQMMLQAVRMQDLFLVLGNMVMIAILLILGNLIADILLMAVDPRIRVKT